MAAINLEVSVSISGFALILFLSYRTIIIWVFFYSYWMSELFRNGKKFWKVCESVSHEWLCGYWTDFCDWYLIKSGSFCLKCWLHASTKLFLLWQQRPNFLNSCHVIFTSDNTMLMQETVISFEDVMLTKLKVRLCISRSSTQSLTIVKETCFSSKGFLLLLLIYG